MLKHHIDIEKVKIFNPLRLFNDSASSPEHYYGLRQLYYDLTNIEAETIDILYTLYQRTKDFIQYIIDKMIVPSKDIFCSEYQLAHLLVKDSTIEKKENITTFKDIKWIDRNLPFEFNESKQLPVNTIPEIKMKIKNLLLYNKYFRLNFDNHDYFISKDRYKLIYHINLDSFLLFTWPYNIFDEFSETLSEKIRLIRQFIIGDMENDILKMIIRKVLNTILNENKDTSSHWNTLFNVYSLYWIYQQFFIIKELTQHMSSLKLLLYDMEEIMVCLHPSENEKLLEILYKLSERLTLPISIEPLDYLFIKDNANYIYKIDTGLILNGKYKRLPEVCLNAIVRYIENGKSIPDSIFNGDVDEYAIYIQANKIDKDVNDFTIKPVWIVNDESKYTTTIFNEKCNITFEKPPKEKVKLDTYLRLTKYFIKRIY